MSIDSLLRLLPEPPVNINHSAEATLQIGKRELKLYPSELAANNRQLFQKMKQAWEECSTVTIREINRIVSKIETSNLHKDHLTKIEFLLIETLFASCKKDIIERMTAIAFTHIKSAQFRSLLAKRVRREALCYAHENPLKAHSLNAIAISLGSFEAVLDDANLWKEQNLESAMERIYKAIRWYKKNPKPKKEKSMYRFLRSFVSLLYRNAVGGDKNASNHLITLAKLGVPLAHYYSGLLSEKIKEFNHALEFYFNVSEADTHAYHLAAERINLLTGTVKTRS